MTKEKPPYEPKWMKYRATSQARRHIAEFITDNSEHLSEWLQRVAYGIPKANAEGEILRDADGSIIYLVKPDPFSAIKAVSDLAEYHLPRLTRQDVAVVGKIEHQHLEPGQMNSEQLQRALLEQFGLGPQPEGEIIDVEVVREPVPVVPDWLK